MQVQFTETHKQTERTKPCIETCTCNYLFLQSTRRIHTLPSINNKLLGSWYMSITEHADLSWFNLHHSASCTSKLLANVIVRQLWHPWVSHRTVSKLFLLAHLGTWQPTLLRIKLRYMTIEVRFCYIWFVIYFFSKVCPSNVKLYLSDHKTSGNSEISDYNCRNMYDYEILIKTPKANQKDISGLLWPGHLLITWCMVLNL